jgi:hypothetical protein
VPESVNWADHANTTGLFRYRGRPLPDQLFWNSIMQAWMYQKTDRDVVDSRLAIGKDQNSIITPYGAVMRKSDSLQSSA